MDLESRLADWRQSMQAAGIGPGPVRDELESHLRDTYDDGMRRGLSPEAAFAEATAKLGPPRDLQQEYRVALTPWTRFKRSLDRCSEFFPTDMRACAWAALPVGAYSLYWRTVIAYGMRDFFWRAIETKNYKIALMLGLSSGFFIVVNLIGLQAAIRFLRRPAYGSARSLALFWVCTLWINGPQLLMQFIALTGGYRYAWEVMLDSRMTIIAYILFIPIVFVSFYVWKRRLRASVIKLGT